MDLTVVRRSGIRSLSLIGNSQPRQCGIATFTTDLLRALIDAAPQVDCGAVVMNDVAEGYQYPSEVRFELNDKDLADYRLAAEYLNVNQVDVVSLQHEFGIYGGTNGSFILELLNNLRMPVVTTLHTVLLDPSPTQRSVLKKIAQVSDRLVVLSHKAEGILKDVYGIAPEKVVMIPHGIPDVPFVDPNFFKDLFGVEGRKVILTFGLLSPSKGIEVMIEAMPRIVKEHPDAIYLILGATHPHVLRDKGESYRMSLQLRARELGVGDHIIFHNRFVELEKLCEFIGAADVYVTPYQNKEQIVSGTLAYALGAGKATVSTPYWYAEEMLAEGRGKLVPFHDPGAMAEAICDLLGRETERHSLRKKAYTFCRPMVWREVARRYLEVFADVKSERETQPRPVFSMKTLEAFPRELPDLKLDHLKRMTDDVGILQHAKFIVPDRQHGYCTDDNARALIVTVMAHDLLPEEDRELTDLSCRYLSFLHQAFDEKTGRFRNFMGYDRRWTEEKGSDDSHGRALWALGEVVAITKSESLVGAALSIFEKGLSSMLQSPSPRAWAFTLIGIQAYLRRFSGDSEIRRIREKLANELFRLYQEKSAPDWPWIEDTLTYSNGKIPQALILSGQWLQRDDMVQAGLQALEWLVKIQTDEKGGHFVPIGNNGWMTRNGHQARFDQQPVEAMNMIDAFREAYNATQDEKWIRHAQWCLEWFLGRNDLNAPLYDYETGGCCDGLSSGGKNTNQGAESTLSWQLALLNMYWLMGLKVGSTNPDLP